MSASGNILAHAAEMLEKAGADGFIICTNTMHKIASEMQKKLMLLNKKVFPYAVVELRRETGTGHEISGRVLIDPLENKNP